MDWFRMYSEFAHDPKVQSMPEAMQRRLMMLLCLRCSNALVTLHETEIAFALRITDEDLAETKVLFLRKQFIDDSWGNHELGQAPIRLRLKRTKGCKASGQVEGRVRNRTKTSM